MVVYHRNLLRIFRQLLIGRALYSTCIEPEDAECKIMKDRKEPFDWKTDSAEIFSGWKSEENE